MTQEQKENTVKTKLECIFNFIKYILKCLVKIYYSLLSKIRLKYLNCYRLENPF